MTTKGTDPVQDVNVLPIEDNSPEVNLLTLLEVPDQTTALNVLIAFLDVAQRRGAFAMAESAKIWECLQKFAVRPPKDETSDPESIYAPADESE
jgi:hypothetical protein